MASWRDRAGHHCQLLHQALVEQEALDLVHVQVDEIRVKGRRMTVWMGLALMVSTRLWLAGVVSYTRDVGLADRLLRQVRRCAVVLRPLLVCTDGGAAYPGSIRRALREKVKRTAGRGRSALVAWPEILMATLTRRCRHAAHRLEAPQTGMYLIGCVYNFCVVHDELSSSKHFGTPTTPAMAAGLTDHPWRVHDLLLFKLAPPVWLEPKRRGRPRLGSTAGRKPVSARPAHLRPLLRLRKGALRAVTG